MNFVTPQRYNEFPRFRFFITYMVHKEISIVRKILFITPLIKNIRVPTRLSGGLSTLTGASLQMLGNKQYFQPKFGIIYDSFTFLGPQKFQNVDFWKNIVKFLCDSFSCINHHLILELNFLPNTKFVDQKIHYIALNTKKCSKIMFLDQDTAKMELAEFRKILAGI